MPTEYKPFFNQLDNNLKPLKTNHLIEVLKADPHLKFLFLHYQTLTYMYPFQSQCTITFQAGTFLKICHNLHFREGVALAIAKLFYMATMELCQLTANAQAFLNF